jgi:hypothetical protein
MRGVRCGTGWAIPARVSNLIGWNAGFLVRIRLPSRYRARDRSSRVGHGPYTVLMKLPDVSSRFPMRQCARSGRRKEKLMRRAHGSPSSLARAETRLLGRDSCGHWIVQEPGGQCGGIFLNRAEAVKFALFDEVDHRPSSRTRDAQDNAREKVRGRAGLCHERCKASTCCLKRTAERETAP